MFLRTLFTRHKLYSRLNILGFAFALTTVLFIGMYAYRELNMNMFHRDADRIYKISGWGCPYALAPGVPLPYRTEPDVLCGGGSADTGRGGADRGSSKLDSGTDQSRGIAPLGIAPGADIIRGNAVKKLYASNNELALFYCISAKQYYFCPNKHTTL